MLPSEDRFFPHTTTYYNGTTETEQVHRECGHIAKVQMAYAPDIGRNWFKCTGCDKEWVGDDQDRAG